MFKSLGGSVADVEASCCRDMFDCRKQQQSSLSSTASSLYDLDASTHQSQQQHQQQQQQHQPQQQHTTSSLQFQLQSPFFVTTETHLPDDDHATASTIKVRVLGRVKLNTICKYRRFNSTRRLRLSHRRLSSTWTTKSTTNRTCVTLTARTTTSVSSNRFYRNTTSNCITTVTERMLLMSGNRVINNNNNRNYNSRRRRRFRDRCRHDTLR